MRRVLAWLVVLGAVLIAQPVALAVAAEAADQAHVNAFDTPHHAYLLTYDTTERGPPGPHDSDATHDVADRRSGGVSARPDRATTGAATTYDDPASCVRLALAATTTGRQVQVIAGDLCAPQGAGVAAKTRRKFENYGGEFIDDAIRSPVVRPDVPGCR